LPWRFEAAESQSAPRGPRGGAGRRRGNRHDRPRPKLMLRAIMRISGLEGALRPVENRIEDRAQDLIQQGKAVAVETLIAAGLAPGAAATGPLAPGRPPTPLFHWLERH